jgi:hypothetical protein
MAALSVHIIQQWEVLVKLPDVQSKTAWEGHGAAILPNYISSVMAREFRWESQSLQGRLMNQRSSLI